MRRFKLGQIWQRLRNAGDDMFFQIETGPADKRVVLADPVGGLVNGSLPYVTTNGRLTTDAGITYGSGTLTINTIGGLGGLFIYDGFTKRFEVNASSGNAELPSGRIASYNNLVTEGFGVPAIADDVALTGQVANIASTNFTNAGVAGTYRLAYYMVCTTAAVGGGTISFVCAYNDGVAARTLTGTALSLTATGRVTTYTDTVANGTLIKLGSGSVSYSVTVTGIYSTAVYALYCTLERVS